MKKVHVQGMQNWGLSAICNIDIPCRIQMEKDWECKKDKEDEGSQRCFSYRYDTEMVWEERVFVSKMISLD